MDKLAADDADAESAVDALLQANLLGLPKEDLELGYWDWSGLLLLLPVAQVGRCLGFGFEWGSSEQLPLVGPAAPLACGPGTHCRFDCYS